VSDSFALKALPKVEPVGQNAILRPEDSVQAREDSEPFLSPVWRSPGFGFKPAKGLPREGKGSLSPKRSGVPEVPLLFSLLGKPRATAIEGRPVYSLTADSLG
jgi:hypothetical protein